MNKIISAFYSNTKLYVYNLNYMPRLIILFIDVFLTICASAMTFVLMRSLKVTFYTTLDVPTRYSIIILVNFIFFLVFKTYRGILRLSTLIDAIKLLYASACSCFVLIVINYSTYFVIGKKIYLLPSLLLNFIFSFLILFSFRIFIKIIFENLNKKNNSSNVLKAVIYGADFNVLAVINSLNTEKPIRFNIVGFIDKKNQNSDKRILDIPILNVKNKISKVLSSVEANALIIADETLTKQEKISILEDCLEHNIKVFTVPKIKNLESEMDVSNKIINFKIDDLLDRNSIILDKKAIAKELHNKTILITGAAGSIGSEIVRQAISFNPKKIILLDQAETPLHHLKSEIEQLISETNLRTIICDIRNKETLKEIFSLYKPEIVFHAAAYKHVPMMEDNPAQAIFANVLGTKNTADLSVEFGVKNFVYVSTDKAVNPSNVMGASKRIAEKYIQSLFFNLKEEKDFKTKFITTRFGNVLGSNGSVVPLFTEQIKNGGPVTITHPDIIRYFMTIPEACQLVLEAAAMGKGGEIFIFDMGEPVKIIDLAKKMILLAGLVPHQDIEIKIVGLRPGEKLFEELLNDTSKTIATYHDKITIAEDICKDYSILSKYIDELIVLATTSDSNALVLKMKCIIPEFISMNSEYNKLDV
jgi:FlaA1/EpsC-like NDP-sugar epimerase